MQCPRCEGTGQCTECKGAGWVTCIACEGRGEMVSSRGGAYPCRSCKASGKAECSPQCPSCEGSGKITAELQQKVRDKYEVRFQTQKGGAPVTAALVASCALIYGLGWVSPHLDDWMHTHLSNISGTWTQQPWRLITSAFLHGGLLHLVFNLLALRSFGVLLENLYGSRRFALLWILAALAGSLLSSWGHLSLGDGPVASVGASGALFGLIGALAGGQARYRLYPETVVRDQLLWIGVYTLVSLTMTQRIDHWCHLGGFLAGFAYAWASRRPSGA